MPEVIPAISPVVRDGGEETCVNNASWIAIVCAIFAS